MGKDNLKHLKIDPKTALGDEIMLKEITRHYVWNNGSREEAPAYVYTVASKEMAFDSVDIIIEGKKLLDNIDDFPLVEFQELSLGFEWQYGAKQLVGYAKGITRKGKTLDKSLKIND